MCNCISDIKEKALRKYKEEDSFNKPVESVSMREISFPIIANRLEMRTYTTLEIQLAESRRRKSTTIIHTFCPFCGEKYGEQPEVPAEG